MPIKLNSTGGGSVTLDTPSTANSYTLLIPATNGSLATTTGTTFSDITVTGNSYFATSSGNVGIGTSTPSFPLEIAGSTANIRLAPAVTTNSALLRLSNSGGNSYVGIDNSTGGLGAAYGLHLYQGGAYPIVFSTNGTERMRIDSSGNVGIGTNSPASRLEVAGTGVPLYANSTNSNGAKIAFTDNGTARGYLGATSSYMTVFYNSAGNAVDYIDTSGNLIIGTSTSGGYKLRVSGTTGIYCDTVNNNAIYAYASGTGYGLYGQSSGGIGVYGLSATNYGIYGLVSGGAAGNLYGVFGKSDIISTYASGGVFGYSINSNTYGILGYWSGSAYWSLYANGSTYIAGTYQGSDARLKENIDTITGSLAKISALRPVEFDWKDTTDQYKNGLSRDVGLIAQEVLPIIPGIVKEIEALETQDGNQPTLNEELGTFYTIEYSRLVPYLINAVQELKAELDELKAKVNA